MPCWKTKILFTLLVFAVTMDICKRNEEYKLIKFSGSKVALSVFSPTVIPISEIYSYQKVILSQLIFPSCLNYLQAVLPVA